MEILNKISKNRNVIIYWVATLWLSLGMLSTGIVQLINEQTTVDFMVEAGYPLYFLTILGVGKILGVIAILIPKTPLIKEWAYAGFFYIVAGAAYTYIATDNLDDIYHLGLLLALIVVSWYWRPSERKVVLGR